MPYATKIEMINDIPDGFRPVEEQVAQHVLDDLDWYQHACSDGEKYYAIGHQECVAFHAEDGKWYLPEV